jgi:hypothetical protein
LQAVATPATAGHHPRAELYGYIPPVPASRRRQEHTRSPARAHACALRHSRRGPRASAYKRARGGCGCDHSMSTRTVAGAMQYVYVREPGAPVAARKTNGNDSFRRQNPPDLNSVAVKGPGETPIVRRVPCCIPGRGFPGRGGTGAWGHAHCAHAQRAQCGCT